jgi:hypothetical protein
MPSVALRTDAAWEGGKISGPSAAWIGGELFLYYAGAGGIGLARTKDGATFTKEPAPVLAPDRASTWERVPPSAPSVAVYPDGRIRMLYTSGVAIGEAESTDGVTWRRLGPDPVIIPDPGAMVTDPCLLPRITPAGRLHVRVLYTGTDAAGVPSIGFAARYGDSGPFSKQTAPVYAIQKNEAQPALFEWSGGSILYVRQDDTSNLSMVYPAIAAAYAPANLRLAAAVAYPDSL